MEARPFRDKQQPPNPAAHRAALGPAAAFHAALEPLFAGFRSDWIFSRSSGWLHKIHDGRKALLYFIPLNGAFRLSMALREPERDALLALEELRPLHDRLRAARRASEGFALQLDVEDPASSRQALDLVRALVAIRAPPPG